MVVEGRYEASPGGTSRSKAAAGLLEAVERLPRLRAPLGESFALGQLGDGLLGQLGLIGWVAHDPEYYCRRVFDEDCFVERLTRVLEASDTLLPEYQLWNEVAKDKATFLLEMQDELF